MMYDGMPKSLSWETTIAGKSEPGEPLEMSGTIFGADGKTPASGIILYVYHTDATGHYIASAYFAFAANALGFFPGQQCAGG